MLKTRCFQVIGFKSLTFLYAFYFHEHRLPKLLHKLPLVFKSAGFWKSKSHGQKGQHRFRSQTIFYVIRLGKKRKVALITARCVEGLTQVSYQKNAHHFHLAFARRGQLLQAPLYSLKVTRPLKLLHVKFRKTAARKKGQREPARPLLRENRTTP